MTSYPSLTFCNYLLDLYSASNDLIPFHSHSATTCLTYTAPRLTPCDLPAFTESHPDRCSQNLLQPISSTKWCSSFQAGNVLILVSFAPKADLARPFRASHQLSHCRQGCRDIMQSHSPWSQTYLHRNTKPCFGGQMGSFRNCYTPMMT